MTDLDLDQIINILDQPELTEKKGPKLTEKKWPMRTEQKGPLRRYEKEMTCVNRRTENSKTSCRTPTIYKVMGIPLCSIHALIRLNNMLIELGEHGISHKQ